MPTGTTLTAPFTHAGFLTAGHRLAAATMRQELLAFLADRVSLRRLIQFVGDASGLGSTVMRSLYAQMGAALAMESQTETGTLTPITLGVDYRDITIGRHGLEANDTFLQQITARSGIDWEPEILAQTIAETFEAEFSDAVAAEMVNFTNGVGTSGSDASMDDVYDVTYEFDLEDGVDGPLIGVFHGQQIADIKESKRGEPADWIKDENQVMFKAPGYQGELLGINVFKSNRVTSDGTDRWGGVFTPRAMGYSIAGQGIRAIKGLSQWAVLITELGLILDWGSNSNGAFSTFDANCWFGLEIGDQGDKEGRYFRTDA